MKYKIFKTLLAVVAATMTFCAEADTKIVDGIEWYYTVDEDDGEASVGNVHRLAIPESTSGAITIPSTLGGYPVTRIGEFAFDCCSSLTSVTIPDSVTSIGDCAFSGCSSLTSVTIPYGVKKIGGYAFCKCSSLTTVTMPDSVTIIEPSAFNGCSSLTSVTIPDGITEIGACAFDDCDKLYNRKMIPGVLVVDGWVVGYEETLPEDLDLTGVRGIVPGAFVKCKNLTSVTIPSSVKSIGDGAFWGCGELTFYTDEGNADRLRKMLRGSDANVKEIIEKGHRGFYWGCFLIVLVTGGVFFWIVRRKKNREGASSKTDSSIN